MLPGLVSYTYSASEKAFNTTCKLKSILEETISIIACLTLDQYSKQKTKTSSNFTISPLRFVCWSSLIVPLMAQKTDPFPENILLDTFDQSLGLIVNGEMADFEIGTTLFGGKDVNGDLSSDIIIGAHKSPSVDGQSAGKAYVIFGSTNFSLRSKFEFSELNGSNGFIIEGGYENQLGRHVEFIDDFNGDKISDIIVTAYNGVAHVIFGSKSLNERKSFNVTSLNGSNGLGINTQSSPSSQLYRNSGDFNGDGNTDLLFSDSRGMRGYVLYGSSTIISSGSLTLENLQLHEGIVFNFENRVTSFQSAGDLNDDGYDDIMIYLNNEKKFQVFFGAEELNSTNYTQLNGKNGFTVFCNFSPIRFQSVGDFSGDGIADIIVGSSNFDYHLIYGHKNIGSSGSFEISSINGINGFNIEGWKWAAHDTPYFSTAGDLNGDGKLDLMIGSSKLLDPQGSTQMGYAKILACIYGGTGIDSSQTLKLQNLSSTNGFQITYSENVNSPAGIPNAFAGDFNLDGITDIMFGDPSSSASSSRDKSGRVFILWGRKVATNGMNSPNNPSNTGRAGQNPLATDLSAIEPTSQTDPSAVYLPISITFGMIGMGCCAFGSWLTYKSRTKEQDNEIKNVNNYGRENQINSQMETVRNHYDDLVIANQPSHYNNLPQHPQVHDPSQYDQVRMSQLNRNMDHYIETQPNGV